MKSSFVFIQGKIKVNSLCLLIHRIKALSNKKSVHIQFICSLMITDSMNQWVECIRIQNWHSLSIWSHLPSFAEKQQQQGERAAVQKLKKRTKSGRGSPGAGAKKMAGQPDSPPPPPPPSGDHPPKMYLMKGRWLYNYRVILLGSKWVYNCKVILLKSQWVRNCRVIPLVHVMVAL